MSSFKTWVLTHKKSAVISFLVVPLTLSLWLNFGLEYRVLFNMTNSLPHTLYLTHPPQAVLKRGDYGNCQASCRAFNLSSSFFLAAFFVLIALCFQPFIWIQ